MKEGITAEITLKIVPEEGKEFKAPASKEHKE
jgi:hypothetical protein